MCTIRDVISNFTTPISCIWSHVHEHDEKAKNVAKNLKFKNLTFDDRILFNVRHQRNSLRKFVAFNP